MAAAAAPATAVEKEPRALLLSRPGVYNEVKVHPVVLLSILDHYLRRNETQDRVIGTLLGSVENGVVDVRDCFPVPHNETAEQVAVDMEFQRHMFELHRRVSPNDAIVGWYASGTAVTEHSVLIQEFYAREAGDPVHLLLDAAATTGAVTALAYASAPVGFTNAPEEAPPGSVFVPIRCGVRYHEAERVGIRMLQCAAHDSSVRGGAGEKLLTGEVAGLEAAVERLRSLVADAATYVGDVIAGRRPGDAALGRRLAEAVSRVPQMESAEFEPLFNDALQDLLMVGYLASLTRSQLAISDRLNAIL